MAQLIENARGARLWRRADIGACAVLTALNAVWLMTLGLSFFVMDDPQYVTQNALVLNGVSWHGTAWAFTTTMWGFWMPVTWLSLQLDAAIYGMHAWGYHLTNAVLHTANALLVYVFFRKTMGRGANGWRASLFAAALFAIHPQRVESVAWITERKDVLAFFFGMLTLLAYLRYVRRPGIGRYGVVLGCYLLSLWSKPMLLMLPVLLLVLDAWPLERMGKGQRAARVKEKVPLFLVAAAMSVNTFLIQFTAGSLESTWGVRVKNAVLDYFLYVRDFFYTGRLSVIDAPRMAIPWWEVAGAALFVAVVTAWGFRAARRGVKGGNAFWMGWLWFAVIVLPMSGILQSGINIRADRFSYFPAVGIVIALAWGVLPMARVERLPQWISGAAAVLVIAGTAFFMLQRLALWRDPLLLAEHDLRYEQNGTLHELAGMAAEDRGMRARALEHFRRAGELEPGLRHLYPLAKREYEKADATMRAPGNGR